MIEGYFHRWERRLADASRTARVVRPFDWGLDWIPADAHTNGGPPLDTIRKWIDDVMRDTDAFFTPAPTTDYAFVLAPRKGVPYVRQSPLDGVPYVRQSADEELTHEGLLTFPSALTTPHAENNLVHARWFPAAQVRGAAARAVVVLPQWNSDAEGHVGLCRLLARAGISALRLSLPYHDRRMPPELTRADYIVSANVVRTLQVCRQAVLDARLALWWLRDQGFGRLGMLGTSLGSCLAGLTAWHEPLVRAQALNHISPFFADVVWRGVSTEHVRAGMEGHISLDELRDLWRPINPWSYLDRAHEKKTLLVYARYDLTFPVDLSKKLVDEFARRGIPAEVAVLPCGHYTTGEAPFKFLDAYHLVRFLRRTL